MPQTALFWRNVAQAKVVCSVNSNEELISILNSANEIHLPTAHLEGEGVGIFGPISEVDKVTGKLKLFN